MQIKDLVGFNGKSQITIKERIDKNIFDIRHDYFNTEIVNFLMYKKTGNWLVIKDEKIVGIVRHNVDNIFDFWRNPEIEMENIVPQIIGRGIKYFEKFFIAAEVSGKFFMKNAGNNKEYSPPRNSIVEAILFHCGRNPIFNMEYIPEE